VVKRSVLTVLIVIFHFTTLLGQSKAENHNIPNIEYETSVSIDAFDYSVLTNSISNAHASIIGLGEATHGTSEFFHVKKNIIKNLVEEQGFKNFLLEAGYVACKQFDLYIHNNDVNVDSALSRSVPWPWACNEFKELLNWMREYNLTKTKSDKIHFYGIDICQRRNLINTSNSYYGNICSQPIIAKALEIYNNTALSTKKKRKQLSQLQKECDKQYNIINEDYLITTHVIQSAKVWLRKGGRMRKAREDELFEMFKRIKKSKSAAEKYIIWGHSEHIAQHSNNRKSLGFFINKAFGDKYQTVGFDFNKGSFQAVDIDSLNYGKKEYGVVFYREAPEKTLAYQLENINKGLLFINLTLKTNKKELCSGKKYIQSIGASYGNQLAKNKPSLFLQKLKLCKTFNYLFIVKNTTASHPLFK
jgi:erythromycin esterase